MKLSTLSVSDRSIYIGGRFLFLSGPLCNGLAPEELCRLLAPRPLRWIDAANGFTVEQPFDIQSPYPYTSSAAQYPLFNQATLMSLN
jgi:hypothetical protein